LQAAVGDRKDRFIGGQRRRYSKEQSLSSERGYVISLRAYGVLLLLLCIPIIAAPTQADTGNGSGQRSKQAPDFHFDVTEYGDEWILGDKNDDGVTDYALYLGKDNLKVKEAVDFNSDGKMDDFYFYANEVLVRQEVDTNYDQKIDLWVYLYRGVYVERYERDTDFDGIPDIVKRFDQSDQSR